MHTLTDSGQLDCLELTGNKQSALAVALLSHSLGARRGGRTLRKGACLLLSGFYDTSLLRSLQRTSVPTEILSKAPLENPFKKRVVA